MDEVSTDQVPEGFSPVPRGQGFSDNLQPSYRRIEGDSVSFGLVVQSQHGNLMGICHGGVLMTLADIAAANGVNVARGVQAGSPTINLAVDFIAAARMGEWIQADVHMVTVKRRFGFCSGAIVNSKGVVARFSGTFYLPDHKGMIKPGAPWDDAPGLLGKPD
ncbi:MAG: PaaI family thioesterase [Pseudomonadales bacterium]|nr:PaaI family thioesterase [Pseudomonadales bacterium]